MDRCSEGARSLVRYKGLPTSNQGHIALPPMGSKRLERNALWDDWLKLVLFRHGPRAASSHLDSERFR